MSDQSDWKCHETPGHMSYNPEAVVSIQTPAVRIARRRWSVPFTATDHWITTPAGEVAPWPDNVEDQLLYLLRESIKYPAAQINILAEFNLDEVLYMLQHVPPQPREHTARIWKKVTFI